MRSDVDRRGQIGRLVRQRAVEWEVTRLLGPGAPRADGRATAVAGSDQCRLVGVEIGAYEAKTHLPELLEKARRGATITITKHGVPVARLVPPKPVAARVEDTIGALRELRRKTKPGPPSIREMIQRGRP